jgi:hypothetical protein
MTDRKSERENTEYPRKAKRQQIRNVSKYTKGNKKNHTTEEKNRHLEVKEKNERKKKTR